jgi:hypothetical protein
MTLRTEPVGGGLQRRDVIDSKNAFSDLRKPICPRFSTCSMKLWALRY